MAVAVALLMIGGEFDLSAGVMTGSCGLLMGIILATEVGMSIWRSDPADVRVRRDPVGFLNGSVVVRTGLLDFIVTLATFFVLQGVNLGVTKAITGTVRVGGLRDAAGFERSADLRERLLGLQLPHQRGVVDRDHRAGDVVLSRTRVGNWIFGVGGDRIAARNVGVPVNRVKRSGCS